MYFPISLIEKLREIAKSKDISLSEIIRRALDEWLENQKSK